MLENNQSLYNKLLFTVLLSLLGGMLDIYFHSEYHALVVAQTGNILLLITNLFEQDYTFAFLKLWSIIFFTMGLVCGLFLKDHTKTHYWRTYHFLPLLITTIFVPFIHYRQYFQLFLLAFSSGIIMCSFGTMQYGNSTYTIMLISGNYRQMIRHFYEGFFKGNKKSLQEVKVYFIIILSFIVGAVLMQVLIQLYAQKAIWIVSALIVQLMILNNYYTDRQRRENR